MPYGRGNYGGVKVPALTMRFADYDFNPSWLPSMVTLCLLALLLSLGSWQLGRGTEKQRLLDNFALRSTDLPLQIDLKQRSAEGLQFRLVVGKGRYDTRRQYLLDNRTHGGVAGYHVLTPLRLSEQAGVLVNRGWVPVGERRDRLPDVEVTDKPIVVQGMVAIPSQNAFLLGPAGYEFGAWPRVVQRVELATMEAQLGYSLLPYVVQLDPDEPRGFVRQWQPYVGIGPERHRAYAFQWFSLAVALVIIYVAVNVQRSVRKDEVSD